MDLAIKNVKKVASRGPRGIVAGSGAWTGRQILLPGEWGAEKRPGTSGNGFPGFPVASLSLAKVADRLTA